MENKKSYNKMLIYCPNHKFNIFEDYILSLCDNNDFITVKQWKTGDKIIIDDTYKTIIFLQVLPNHNNKIIIKTEMEVNIFICNTEQLTESINLFIYNITSFYIYCKTKHTNIMIGIIDYSEQNIDILYKHDFIITNNISIHHLPYQYYDTEINNLKKLCIDTRMVSTCGCHSEYRQQIKNNIETNNNIIITLANGFTEIRDTIIGKHKILLNVSSKESFTIFEHIRCDRWIFAGKIIISEYKIDYNNLDISNFIIWSSTEQLGQTVEDVLCNYDTYIKLYNTSEYQNMLSTIITNRKQKLTDFFNLYL